MVKRCPLYVPLEGVCDDAARGDAQQAPETRRGAHLFHDADKEVDVPGDFERAGNSNAFLGSQTYARLMHAWALGAILVRFFVVLGILTF